MSSSSSFASQVAYHSPSPSASFTPQPYSLLMFRTDEVGVYMFEDDSIDGVRRILDAFKKEMNDEEDEDLEEMVQYMTIQRVRRGVSQDQVDTFIFDGPVHDAVFVVNSQPRPRSQPRANTWNDWATLTAESVFTGEYMKSLKEKRIAQRVNNTPRHKTVKHARQ